MRYCSLPCPSGPASAGTTSDSPPKHHTTVRLMKVKLPVEGGIVLCHALQVTHQLEHRGIAHLNTIKLWGGMKVKLPVVLSIVLCHALQITHQLQHNQVAHIKTSLNSKRGTDRSYFSCGKDALRLFTDVKYEYKYGPQENTPPPPPDDRKKSPHMDVWSTFYFKGRLVYVDPLKVLVQSKL